MSFTIAQTIDEALAAVADGAKPIAGGSDLVVNARHGAAPLPDKIVAIDRVAELGTIEATDSGHRIGAVVRHAQLMIDPTIIDNYTALADASALVGSPATRNVGTLGGNVMNGSPAMDTGAPLTVLGAMRTAAVPTCGSNTAEPWRLPLSAPPLRSHLATTTPLQASRWR